MDGLVCGGRLGGTAELRETGLLELSEGWVLGVVEVGEVEEQGWRSEW